MTPCSDARTPSSIQPGRVLPDPTRATIEAVRNAGAYRRDIRGYLGSRRVLHDDKIGPFEECQLQKVIGFLDDIEREPASFRMTRLRFPRTQAVTLHRVKKAGFPMIVREKASGRVLGGTCFGASFVREEARGRGIGALIAFTADVQDDFLRPTHFSKAGFRARLAAHALHVRVAIENGFDDIPADVLALYRPAQDGHVRLASPWTMIDQNRHAAMGFAAFSAGGRPSVFPHRMAG